MLDALPYCERNRLENLAWSVCYACDCKDTLHDRIYAGVTKAAELLGQQPESLVDTVIEQGTSVGYVMIQSGRR